MTESKPSPKPLPSRLLKLAARSAPWCLGLTAAAWLVFALVWGTLHGWIVPRIGEFRPQLEAKVSQALGVPVRIGAISAQSTGLIPSFELRDVSLLDADGRTALKLPRVLAALSPASLWKRGFEQLIIDQPELDIRRRADGKILIAGLDMTRTDPGDTSPTADWLFAQTEVVVRQGTLRWTDEQRGAPPLALEGVDLVLRNRGLRHAMRLDATPPAAWGDRFTLMALLRQPLLTTHHGRWQDWRGPAYANFPRVDVSQLRQYLDLGAGVGQAVQAAQEAARAQTARALQGVGAMHVWADVGDGQLLAATADVALADVNVSLAPNLQPLALASLQGRIGGRQMAKGFEFSTEGLAFTTADGLRWPGGNVFLSVLEGEGRVPGQGQFRADRLDLGTLAQIGNRLPLAEATHAALATYAPKGLVERVDATWQGRMEAPSSFKAKGRVSQLEIASSTAPARTWPVPPTGRPGLSGATVDFDLTQAGGRATLAIEKGSLSFPGVFEEPEVPIDTLSTDLSWQSDGDKLSVKMDRLKFANADAEGTAQATWRTSDPAKSTSRSRFPGVLDLGGSLSRADGTRVHRYLPLELGPDVRHYVRDGVMAGAANSVKFKVKGDLWDFPFSDAHPGDFSIVANVQNATYAFIPRSIQPADALPWPPLTQLDGELVFDRQSMRIRNARGKLGGVAGMPALPVSRAEAEIPNLAHTVVNVSADARGPLADMLTIVRGSPIDALTGHALTQASATGPADLKLKLALPIANIDKSKVQGSVTLAGNDVQLMPDTPLLGRARGVIGFSDAGFSIAGGQARVLGGDLKFEGGAQPPTSPGAEPALLFRGQGVVTAEGLRQARELEGMARLAENTSGSTAYNAVLAFRRGVAELTLTSSLQGLALNLPPPLNKTAESSLPLRFERSLTPASAANPKAALQDQLALEIGRVVSVAYTRDIGGPAGQAPRVLRGAITVGAPSAEAPAPGATGAPGADGVAANVDLDWINLDAWQSLMTTSPAPASVAAGKPAAAGAHAGGAAQAYMPTRVALRAKALATSGRTLHNLVVGATREDQGWKADVDADELNGYVEYHPAASAASSGIGAGRVYARLKRLVIAPSAATAVDSLLDAPAESVPALDIVVDDFDLKGHNLGRLEMEAVNRGGNLAQREGAVREWRLTRLSVSNPQASFTASGNWAALNTQANIPNDPNSPGSLRRTVMNFKLDIVDAGGLLGRFDMKDVFRRGKGRMEGQIAWVGSPLSLDYPTLAGQLNVNVESGQFLQADPGLTKLLGVLSLQALPRRLTLDFRDVFSEGFAFDFIRGDVRIDQGIASTNNLQMKGVNAAVLMEGRADIARETQDLKVVVIPEINAGTASLVATVINPAIGVGTFLAQMFLRRPLMEAATQEFHVDGSWADPKITKTPRRSILSPNINEDKTDKVEALGPARNGATR